MQLLKDLAIGAVALNGIVTTWTGIVAGMGGLLALNPVCIVGCALVWSVANAFCVDFCGGRLIPVLKEVCYG